MATYVYAQGYYNIELNRRFVLFSTTLDELRNFQLKYLDIKDKYFSEHNFYGCYYLTDKQAEIAEKHGAQRIYSIIEVQRIMEERSMARLQALADAITSSLEELEAGKKDIERLKELLQNIETKHGKLSSNTQNVQQK